MQNDFSLADLEALAESDPLIAKMIQRRHVQDYESFSQIILEDLRTIISEMESKRDQHQEDGEDRITSEIIHCLKLCGYHASHDEKVGGHTDILIRRDHKNWIWYGESKLDNGPAYLVEGMLQLTTRYMRGSVGGDRGALLIYMVKYGNAVARMETWRTSIPSSGNLNCSDCSDLDPQLLSFSSTHIHDGTGRNLYVEHLPVCLNHKPRDAAARKSKSRK